MNVAFDIPNVVCNLQLVFPSFGKIPWACISEIVIYLVCKALVSQINLLNSSCELISDMRLDGRWPHEISGLHEKYGMSRHSPLALSNTSDLYEI